MAVSPSIGAIFSANSVPHILESIFSYLDYGTIMKCRDVCREWNSYVTEHLLDEERRPKWMAAKEEADNMLSTDPTFTDFEDSGMDYEDTLSYITGKSKSSLIIPRTNGGLIALQIPPASTRPSSSTVARCTSSEAPPSSPRVPIQTTASTKTDTCAASCTSPRPHLMSLG
jgi:hypothetical protein